MKKSTKGALAAAAAGVLLLGGAGTLAYWTDNATVDGGTIGTGDMAISDPSCTGWSYDSGEVVAGATFTPGTSKLVPGDVISQTCTVTFTGVGEHLRATISATSASGDSLFTATAPNNLILDQGDLEVSTDSGATWDPVPVSGLTEADTGALVHVPVTVTFNSAATAAMDVDSSLSDIVITASQIHN